jgi:hypothetical protein
LAHVLLLLPLLLLPLLLLLLLLLPLLRLPLLRLLRLLLLLLLLLLELLLLLLLLLLRWCGRRLLPLYLRLWLLRGGRSANRAGRCSGLRPLSARSRRGVTSTRGACCRLPRGRRTQPRCSRSSLGAVVPAALLLRAARCRGSGAVGRVGAVRRPPRAPAQLRRGTARRAAAGPVSGGCKRIRGPGGRRRAAQAPQASPAPNGAARRERAPARSAARRRTAPPAPR